MTAPLPQPRGSGPGVLGSRRGKLVALLLLATVAITVLSVRAAGSSLSYYATPEEFAQKIDDSGTRWRVGGRVVEGSVVETNGRPSMFTIYGDHGERMDIQYGGIKPNLFGPGAFVVIEGVSDGPGRLKASSVIIKHENEFLVSPTPGPAGGIPPVAPPR